MSISSTLIDVRSASGENEKDETRQTLGNLLLALPRCLGECQIAEGDFDMRMVCSDPVEDGGWFCKRQNDEEMFRLRPWASSHHERGDEVEQA